MNLCAGGLFIYEVASSDVAFASAGWSARADEPSTVFTNPAGMSRFTCRAVELGAEPIFASVRFVPNDETTVHGDDGNADAWIPSGSFYYIQPVNESINFGIASLGYFGSKLNFNHDWVGRYYVTKAVLQGFSLIPAVSYKISDSLSIGVGANVMYGILHQKAAINNLIDQLDDGNVGVKGSAWGWGAVLGLLWEVNPCTRFGIQYLSELKLKFDEKPHFNDIGPFLELILDATGVLNSRVKIDINVPQSLIFSVYHDIDSCWSVMADLGWQQWSRFQQATITLSDPAQRSLTFTPKLKDTWHAALGAEYRYSCAWTFMTGIAYDSSAVSNKNRPLNLPVGKQWRFGAGAEWQYSDTLAFGFCYEFQTEGDLPVNAHRGPLAGHVDGKYKNVTFQFIDVNAIWTF